MSSWTWDTITQRWLVYRIHNLIRCDATHPHVSKMNKTNRQNACGEVGLSQLQSGLSDLTLVKPSYPVPSWRAACSIVSSLSQTIGHHLDPWSYQSLYLILSHIVGWYCVIWQSFCDHIPALHIPRLRWWPLTTPLLCTSMLHKSNLRQPSVEVRPFWRTLGFFWKWWKCRESLKLIANMVESICFAIGIGLYIWNHPNADLKHGKLQRQNESKWLTQAGKPLYGMYST